MKKLDCKKKLFAVFVFALIFWSCKTGVYEAQYGKEDIAYITVMSSSNYAGKTVDVIIDGSTVFQAKVVKMKQDSEKRKGDMYGIRTGKRHVIVKYQGTVLYEKDIFVSSQQSKNIII